MNTYQKIFVSLFFTIIILAGCNDDENFVLTSEPELPAQLANYSEPSTASSFWLDESRFEVDDATATLGRVLFYDKILSRNNDISCGSCHLQERSFADDRAFSAGTKGQVLTRNTPAIINAYDDAFLFWDGRSGSLHDLSLRPVRNHKEMGLDETAFIIAKVQKAPYYAELFSDAFGSDEVDEDRISTALSHFMASMISGNSKWDRVQAGTETFNQLEELGRTVFFGDGRCYQCHLGQDFNERGAFFGNWGEPAANIGLDEEYADNGFGEFTPSREGEFKIPTLRNIALTAPYMHDGRFETLEEVVNHYNKNIADHPNLSFELQDWNTAGPARLGLDEQEVVALVRFLETFTDEDFASDPKFSDPFK